MFEFLGIAILLSLGFSLTRIKNLKVQIIVASIFAYILWLMFGA